MTTLQLALTMYAVGTTALVTIPCWHNYRRIDLALASYLWPVLFLAQAVMACGGED